MPPAVDRIRKAAAPLQPSAGVKASASQVLVSALERGHGRCAVSIFQQRSRAGRPAQKASGHAGLQAVRSVAPPYAVRDQLPNL
jgi:superfamily II helicase